MKCQGHFSLQYLHMTLYMYSFVGYSFVGYKTQGSARACPSAELHWQVTSMANGSNNQLKRISIIYRSGPGLGARQATGVLAGARPAGPFSWEVGEPRARGCRCRRIRPLVIRPPLTPMGTTMPRSRGPERAIATLTSVH